MIVIQHLWTTLSAMQVSWLIVTLGAYILGDALQRACGGSALANPGLAAIILVASIVVVSGTDYKVFATQTQFVSFLLGPATVALAVPLARSVWLVWENLLGVGLAVRAGAGSCGPWEEAPSSALRNPGDSAASAARLAHRPAALARAAPVRMVFCMNHPTPKQAVRVAPQHRASIYRGHRCTPHRLRLGAASAPLAGSRS